MYFRSETTAFREKPVKNFQGRQQSSAQIVVKIHVILVNRVAAQMQMRRQQMQVLQAGPQILLPLATGAGRTILARFGPPHTWLPCFMEPLLR